MPAKTLEMMQKLYVDQIDDLSRHTRLSRRPCRRTCSTVGTVTEIYVTCACWGAVGIRHPPATGLPIEKRTVNQMVDRVGLAGAHAPDRPGGAGPRPYRK